LVLAVLDLGFLDGSAACRLTDKAAQSMIPIKDKIRMTTV
jgi:hypothetical protein